MTIAVLRPIQEGRPLHRVIPYYGNLDDLQQRMQIEYYPVNQERQLLEILWDRRLRQAVFSNQQGQMTTVLGEEHIMPISLRIFLWRHNIDMTRIAVDGIQLREPRGYHLVLDHAIETMADVFQLEIWASENNNDLQG